MTETKKWYHSRVGWIGFFKSNFDKVRPLVRFYSGSQAGNKLDRFKDIDETTPVKRLQELWYLLQQAWEDAPDDYSQTHCMTGWYELCDLCSEGMTLLDDNMPVEKSK